ncbi:MAG: hypothetical protein CMP95_00430 [Gammaproteobacteria bacterium]|nr:hypothetical protein [Gammaproteobacteria bacterium]OUV68832.1 MAG: hypothetical protein CBC93_00435 [Gammaproteobacteria bacterium TMED133]
MGNWINRCAFPPFGALTSFVFLACPGKASAERMNSQIRSVIRDIKLSQNGLKISNVSFF